MLAKPIIRLMRRIILLGPPGCGKGTQAAELAAVKGLVPISSGAMFREALAGKTSVGLEAKRYMDAGELVPDETTIRLVTERLARDDCAGGYILDGFPRTLPQAEKLTAIVTIDCVLEIECADEVIIRRLAGRRWHPGSGRVYHVDHSPPRREGLDDVTGESLERRSDDMPETVARRLAVYAEQTKPLSDYYSRGAAGMPRYRRIDGDQGVAEVTADLRTAIE